MIICSGLIFSIGTYIIWPSKQNILAHIKLGFVFTSIIIPVLLADVLKEFDENLVTRFSYISIISAIFYLLGILYGFYFKIPFQKSIIGELILKRIHHEEVVNFISKYTPSIAIFGILLIFLCFAAFGFIPAFSENPFQAKFFRGEYKAAYQPFAVPYRLAYQLISICSVILLATFFIKNRKFYLYLSFVCFIVLLLTLTRGPAAYALILFFACLSIYYKKWFPIFIIFVSIIYPLGSLFYWFLGNIFDIKQLSSIYNGYNIWESIAAGSPDVPDQINFLKGFEGLGSPLSFGKTFFGGLVPYNYFWNPSVYSLYIVNNGSADISTLSSGGVRVGLPLWGYSSFGWIGVILVSFLSGTIWGISTKYIKKSLQRLNVISNMRLKVGSALILFYIYDNVFRLISEFYIFSIYSLVSILIIRLFLYGNMLIKDKPITPKNS